MSLLSLSGKIPIFREATLRLRHQLLVDYTICCGLGSLKPNHLPLNNNNWTLFRHLMENCSFIRSGVISVNQKITEDGGSSTMNMILNQIREECCGYNHKVCSCWWRVYLDEQNSEYILASGHAVSVKILFTVVVRILTLTLSEISLNTRSLTKMSTASSQILVLKCVKLITVLSPNILQHEV